MSPAEFASTPFAHVLNERLRILVVDDDPIHREFATTYLTTPSTMVDTAGNAESGLRLLGSNDYEIALVDLDMPGMGGLEMIRLMRSSPRLRNVPVVIVTQHDDVASIERCYDAGATSFLTKPVNWKVLAYHLRFLLRTLAVGRV
jgi:DNA-binding response OmpR family regulator